MPEMGGLEATRRIRERWKDDRNPVVIAMTASSAAADRAACADAGMDDYVPKPVSIAEIRAAFDRLAISGPS